jgi:hypothetical protein
MEAQGTSIPSYLSCLVHPHPTSTPHFCSPWSSKSCSLQSPLPQSPPKELGPHLTSWSQAGWGEQNRWTQQLVMQK